MAETVRRQVVLLGAGHAHLYSLKRTVELIRRGHNVVLVAPEPFWYSGLATGMLGGFYPPELDQVDVGALVTAAGGRFIRDRAVRIDAKARTVYLEHGAPLVYDVVSLNLGSGVPVDTIPGAERGYAVKPISNLWHLREDLKARLRRANAAQPIRVVIIGAGPTGCEIAANIQRLAHDLRGAASITIMARGDQVLEQLSPRAAQCVGAALRRRGIIIRLHAPVNRIEPRIVVTEDGHREPFDVLVNAAGLRPSPVVRTMNLPIDDDGALLVDASLRSLADPRVHGGGDCVALQPTPLAKIGVFAVRQAPILFHNLLASLEGTLPRRFVPQRRYLLILNLGDGTGLAVRGRFYWHGRLAFWLKDFIDRRFLAEYRDPGQS